MKSSSSSREAADGVDAKPLPLEPFVRNLLLQMDNCGATNKSQCFGGLGVLLLLGILDSIEYPFIVVGHTKFNPDVIFRHIAGKYNVND